MKTTSLSSLIVLMALVASMRSTVAQSPTAVEVARQIQAYYDTLRDFRADFTMTYQGVMQRQTVTERGDVRIKKPSRMWWNYTSPDKYTWVADGSQVYFHSPQDKFGIVTPMQQAGDAPTALLFLAGKGDLVRDFTPALPPSQPEGEWHLALTPKTRQPDFNTLTLIVDRRSLALRGLVMNTEDSTQTFRFAGFRANTGLKDSDFVFQFPKGTEYQRR